jgi:protein-tyrosine-phosphatase
VAFVCTGNRFRSPLAAALLGDRAKGLPVAVDSLGTLELGPVPALPEAVELAERYGVDLSGHRARNIAEVDLAPYDLVLGFEQMHVATAVVDGGAALERTFTLPELVELLGAAPAPPVEGGAIEQARAKTRAAHAARGPEYPKNTVPEIADPLGKPWPSQRRIAEELQVLVGELSSRLFS